MSTPDILVAFNLGGPETIWIFLLLLLLFGAKKLPQLARGIGQSLGEFRKAKEEFESEIRNADVEIDHPKVRAPREPRLEVSTAPRDEPVTHAGDPDHPEHSDHKLASATVEPADTAATEQGDGKGRKDESAKPAPAAS